jgi:Tfp pilus assembly protein PilF
MPIIVLPLREIVLDPENPVDLTALPPEQAIELIKESYGFLSNATDISIESGVLTIHLPDEDAQRIDEAAKWFRHGVKHAESGDYRRAIQLFRRTLERLPNHVEARRNLAMAYLESGEEEQAKNLLIETLRLDPKDAWSYLLLGNILAKHDRKSDVAEKYYRRAFELNPRDAILLANYGALMVERGNREQAEEFFERAIEANPSYPNAYYALALLDEQDNHPEKGLSVLDRLFAESKPFDSRGLPLMNEARKLYLEINRQIAEQAYDELMALIEEKKGEIERQSGYPIQVVQDNSLETVSAVSQMAWKHSWKEHRIRYRLKHRAFTPHLIAHELMHIRFEQAAREAGKNRHFTTTAQTQELALRSVRDYVLKLRDQGYKESVITEALRQMVGGLTNQLFNTPLDMMIEKALYDNWPKLRPSQFASVHAIYREGLEAFTNKDISGSHPLPFSRRTRE